MQPTIKAITNIPGWVFGEGVVGKVTTAAQAYDRIPIVRRGVNIIADSLVSVPYHFSAVEGGGEAEWPFASAFDELLAATARAYLICGAAYWLKLANRVRTAGVQWLNPTTMTVEYAGRRPDGSLGLRFTQQAEGKTRTWDETQVVYFRQWHIGDDITPGRSVVDCVLDAANLHFYMTRYGKTTFENGAMPVVLMSVEGNASEEDLKRADSFFRRMMGGVQNAMRVLGVNGMWKPQVITPPLNTLAMPELAAYALRQVAMGMGVPETLLSDAANYATAAQHDTQFWKNTILPLAESLAHTINLGLLEPLGLRLEFAPDEMDVFQDDESTRASSLQSLVGAGLPLPLAMQILGYDLPGQMTYAELEALLADTGAGARYSLPLPAGDAALADARAARPVYLAPARLLPDSPFRWARGEG